MTAARLLFAVTAAVVLAGLIIQVPVAADNEGGFFTTPGERAANVFAFFTIQSNIIVMVTCGLLAARLDRPSFAFRVARLTGLLAITTTFAVFHLKLRDLQDLTGQAAVADVLLHTASPLLCVAGWIAVGPRRRTSWPVVWWTLAFPLAWALFTLIRGAIVDWYPYPFIDVLDLGYARTFVNIAVIGAGFVGAAALAHLIDPRLPDLASSDADGA